jgi:ElaB/YqjD/DUF883 family membrane-anchored ribosome-binding protein
MRNEHSSAGPSARDVAQKELREVLSSTEALLAALGDQGGEAIDELRNRLTSTISDVKKELGSSFVASAREKITQARDTVTAVGEFVQERPWTSVAIGAAVGLLAGLLLKD